MTRISARSGLILAAMSLGMGALAVNCSKTDRSTDDVGGIKLALSLPSGATINSVDWQIMSSSNMVLRSGTINTSDVNATASVDTSCPQSTGDTLVMTATTTAGVACRGVSMPFNVVAGQTVGVNVQIVCGGGTTPQNNGTVVGNGSFVDGNFCPLLSSWVASPLQTSARGGRIDVAVAATDANMGETLTYAWTATSGSFVAPGSAMTQYVCDAAGAQTLTITVTDSHMPPCSVTMTFPVTCVAVMGQGGAGGAGGMATGGAGGMATGGAGGMATGGAGGMATGGAGGMATGGAGGMATGGAGGTNACVTCEMSNPNCPASFLVPPAPQGNGMWGCSGFPAAQQTACNNLLNCIRTMHCANGDDPLPCACGTLDASTCITSFGMANGVCLSFYNAAAAGGNVLNLFNDPTSPVGIADNLTTCDVDAPCTMQCTSAP